MKPRRSPDREPPVVAPSIARTGYILLAHGARDPAWAQPFEHVATLVRERSPATPVTLAFLEFIAPDLVRAGEALADAGCTAIEVVPLFLGAGGHVRKDVPALIERLRVSRPRLVVSLRSAIGEDTLVIEAMASVVLSAAPG